MTAKEAIDVLFNEWKCIDRNDGIHCDRKCETCDLVMDVGIIREAFNMAISALQAQEAKAQLSREDTTSDPISRQAALDALIALTVYSNKRDLVKEADNHPNTWIEGVAECIDEIEDMPSAHPEIEERKEESAQNVPKEDLISRKAAIDAVKDADVCVAWNGVISNEDAVDIAIRATKRSVIGSIEELPSAQPEVLACGEGVLNAQPEIVRCKECENWIPGYITDNDDFIPPKCGKYQQMVGHSSDDYCSLAERRTDESDANT